MSRQAATPADTLSAIWKLITVRS